MTAHQPKSDILQVGQCVTLVNNVRKEIPVEVFLVEKVLGTTDPKKYEGVALGTGTKASLLCVSNKTGEFHLRSGSVVHYHQMEVVSLRDLLNFVEREQRDYDRIARESADRARRFRQTWGMFQDALGRT